MDPSSFSPVPTPATTTAVPFTTEPNNNNNHPPPLPLSAPPIPTHPPYADMIYAAIEALKEKDGSSKRAIGKYIEQVYKENLPNTHSTLLTHHLKRLKSSGLLQMVKKSYMIPRSAPQNNAAVTVDSSTAAVQVSPPASRPRGRPRKIPTTQAQAQAQAQAQPDSNNNNVWAALGLADEPVQAVPLEVSKRRPGRPRRSVGAVPAAAAAVSQVGSGLSVATPARRGRPPGSKSVSKRRPGRPPKNVHVSASAAAPAVAAVGVVSGLPKRRPGRPAKNNQSQPTPIPFAAPTAEVSEAAPVEIAGGDVVSGEVTRSRGRGRPRKNAVPVVAAAPVGVSTAGRGRGRGRGRGSGAGRGRGRGRGGLNVRPTARPGRRPVGRPRKGTTSASAPPNAANEDFKRKLEHFQAKVKESLAVLKPHFNHESPVTSIAAIQELEVLGTMDLNAPLKDEAVLPPQQPQPQQQPLQLVQQQYPLPPQQQVVYQQQFTELHMQQYHQQLQQYPQQPAPQQQQQFHP